MWHWEEIDPARSTQSGDVAKLFKNEAVKQPGVFSLDAPPADATLLAREAIQNSWDAGRALATELVATGEDAPHFRVKFVFSSVEGEEKRALVARLGLGDLAVRLAEVDDRKKLGLANADCLDHLDDPSIPLRLLKVVENGTTGMYGPWRSSESRLFLAMVSIGFTVKAEGSGGSYGYGKSGLIRGSRIRTVLAHTCFREREDDPGVTRRLLGMTYWGTHNPYTGFARLGHFADDAVSPLEDDAADELAAELGIGLRDPGVARDLGSTFLLVDPTVDPADLCRAVERNWWPAIMDSETDFDVLIEDYEGHRVVPRPMGDDALRPFVRGFELALASQDNQHDEEFRKGLGTYKPTGAEDARQLGTVGLKADLGGWSYAANANSDDEDQADHQSLVALVRGPRMVVEYYPVGRMQPFVRGTFLASEDIDDLLRQTEPKAHDAWLARIDEEGVDPLAPRYADEALKRVRKEVRNFRKLLKPPAPREQDIRLPLLDDLFRSILENRGTKNPPPPPPDPRKVAITVEQSVEVVADRIRIRASAAMRLTDRVSTAAKMCRLFVRVAFDEDGRRGDDCGVVLVDPPTGFEIEENVPQKGTLFVGDLTHEWTTIDLVSEAYDPDWTAQLLVGGDVLDDVHLEAEAEEVPV